MPQFPEAVEIVVRGANTSTTGAVRNIFNVFHYRLAAGQPGSLGQLIGDFESTVFSFALAQLSASYKLHQMDARYLADPLGMVSSVPLTTPGGIAGPALPTMVAAVFYLQGQNRGKNYHGSKHFGPIPEASQNGDELSDPAATAWGAVGPKLLADLISGGTTWRPMVLSRKLSQLVRAPVTIVGSDLGAALLNRTLGTMRRRKEKTVR